MLGVDVKNDTTLGAFWVQAADYGQRPVPHSHVRRRRWLPGVRLVVAHHSCDLAIRLPTARPRTVMIPIFATEERD